MSSLYPLRFHPIYKDYLWGGRSFARLFGRSLQAGKIYAESWELADHRKGQSIVCAGPLSGRSLHELLASHGEELLGRHAPLDRFPLLVKFLDAQQRLSVQVHPNDRQAREMGLPDPGKTEAWVILAAEPGSRIWAGFNRPVDRLAVAQAVGSGQLEGLLHHFEPQPGQCVYLPAGTVHALGEGIVVAEIQQSSDNTFRLFDWNRVGKDGKPRPLHVQQALEVVDYQQPPAAPQQPQPGAVPGVETLVSCEKFVINRRVLSSPAKVGGDDRFHIVVVLAGQAAVEGDRCCEPLGAGQTVLLPAGLGPVLLRPGSDRPVTLLDVHLP